MILRAAAKTGKLGILEQAPALLLPGETGIGGEPLSRRDPGK